ncbi:MAG: ribonuclease [Solirubrobacteraceae bacterium]|jgi:ribonuclease Z|nr:ribonuclease [Solirubrobacteraceae bacterium]
MDLSLFFAGTAGSVPSARRGLPALLIRRGADRILIDCGEGTQRQLVRSVGLTDLTDIFLTHLHADHWLGLPGMLKSFELRDRERPLTVHGPPGMTALLERLRPVYGRPRYGLTLRDLEPGEAVRRGALEIVPFAVRHRGVSFGYALVEDERPGRLDAELAERLGVTPGPDFGRLQRGEIVDGVHPEQVVGEPRAGRRIVVTGDTAPTDAVVVAAHRADVLVHEATFADEDADRAALTAHSTARQAAQVAADAEVRLLALTHLSSRYSGGEIRDEARAVFPATEVPRDFDTIEVPLPERGLPQLVRWGPSHGPPRRTPAPLDTPA